VFGPPTRLNSSIPPSVSRPWAPLLGFRRPYSARGEESPRPVLVAQDQPPGSYPGSSPAISLSPATVPPAGFSNLSAACSSLRPPAIFRQVALVGICPSGVCSLSAAPTTRRRRNTLMTFLPRFARAPNLGGGNLGRTIRIPRVTEWRAFGRLQGLHLPRNRSASSLPFKVSTTDLPLLGFHLLMVSLPHAGPASAGCDRHRFTSHRSVARSTTRCVPRP
jgi:hypothetical protein